MLRDPSIPAQAAPRLERNSPLSLLATSHARTQCPPTDGFVEWGSDCKGKATTLSVRGTDGTPINPFKVRWGPPSVLERADGAAISIAIDAGPRSSQIEPQHPSIFQTHDAERTLMTPAQSDPQQRGHQRGQLCRETPGAHRGPSREHIGVHVGDHQQGHQRGQLYRDPRGHIGGQVGSTSGANFGGQLFARTRPGSPQCTRSRTPVAFPAGGKKPPRQILLPLRTYCPALALCSRRSAPAAMMLQGIR